MSDIKQWPVRRPGWVVMLDAFVSLGAALGLAYCFSPYIYYAGPIGIAIAIAVTVALLVFWLSGRNPPISHPSSKALLCLSETGHWHLVHNGSTRRLSLSHTWPAFAWMTLRFCDIAATGPKDTMLELTVWKSNLAPQAWRQLCLQIAGQVSLPEPAVVREA